VATWVEANQEVETGIVRKGLPSIAKYKVFCENCNWHTFADSVIGAKYFKTKHFSERRCLEAEYERIG
jgi:hypothetical protein